MLRRLLALVLLAAFALAAQAIGMPARYAPTEIKPAGTPQRYEFDLTGAIERARREHKRLYLYLSASDCAFCRKYEAFLEKNAAELAPHFAKDWIVFEMRANLSIQADRLWFRIGDKALPYADFMRAIGDERARQLVYPSVWLFDGQGKTLMQMPAGTGTFETVPEQLEILRLEQ
jgi:thioredoxin-related protein